MDPDLEYEEIPAELANKMIIDQIPQALLQTNSNLEEFVELMNDCFMIKDQELELVKETQFESVRDETCRQAVVYNSIVAPVCQSVLEDAENFLTEFDVYFSDLDSAKDSLDLILE